MSKELKKKAIIFIGTAFLAVATKVALPIDEAMIVSLVVDQIERADPGSKLAIELRRMALKSTGVFKDIEENIRVNMTDDKIAEYDARACGNSSLYQSGETVFFRVKDIDDVTANEIDREKLMQFSVKGEQVACANSTAKYEIWVNRTVFENTSGLDLTGLDYIETEANLSIKRPVQ